MRDYLVVDFEFTTYTKPVGRPRGFFSEIIEIGAVLLKGEALEQAAKIQDFVKPFCKAAFLPQAGQGQHGFLHDYRKGHEKGH